MIMVDELQQWPTRIRCFKNGSCHLTTDGSVEGLHAFADRIGMKREWFQPKSTPHYDLTPRRRQDALKIGAVFVSAKDQARRRIAARREA